MREIVNAERIRRFMRELSARAQISCKVYFTGGATAVLLGWRSTTIDVDIKILPENDLLLRAIPNIKESLHINVELASPEQFIPPVPGWEERSLLVENAGPLSFYHYDLYAQALAKLERGHRQDLEDVREMFGRGLIEPQTLLRHYNAIENELHRYPAVDPSTFRASVEEAVGGG